MARNRDLFDDTTMSFGEHLEVLRIHVWRALLGVTVGVVICMFIGDSIIRILKAPISQALREANLPEAQDDLGEKSFADFVREWWNDELPDEPEPDPTEDVDLMSDALAVRVSRRELLDALQIEPPENREPADESTAGDAGATVTLTLRSAEIALLKQAVERANQPVAFRVEEAFMTYLKVTLIAGLALASPWVFYQMWLFVAAGLFPHERKYVHLYLPMSIGLFVAGALFCFYLVFPIVLQFLIGFGKWMGVEFIPRLSEYISLVLMMPLMFGLSFQLPLIMLFLERIGVVTVETYTKNWRMAVLIMSIASMLLTPADPGSMLLMLMPLLVLYMGGVQLCRMRLSGNKDPLAG